MTIKNEEDGVCKYAVKCRNYWDKDANCKMTYRYLDCCLYSYIKKEDIQQSPTHTTTSKLEDDVK